MQPSFFDYALEYQGGRRSTQFLSEMKLLIPYGAIEAILIEKGISFRKFLDIKDEDTIPDETTICKFRNALMRENLMEMIFNQVKTQKIAMQPTLSNVVLNTTGIK